MRLGSLLLACLVGQSGADVRTLAGHAGSVLSLDFSPDGATLASGARDDEVRIWDVKSATPRRILREHGADVYAVRFSPDGAILATGGADKAVRLWETATWKPLRVLEGHADVVRAVSFSPDGRTLASSSADRTIRLWDLATGAPKRVLGGHEGQVRSVAFSPDGRAIASAGTDRTVRLWDPQTGEPRATLRGHATSVECVAWTPDGKRLASGGEDATVRLWRADPPEAVRRLEGHGGEVDCVAFSPCGRILASGSKDRTLRLWDPEDGKLLECRAAHADRVESAAFSRDGKTLATGSGGKDATIKLWPAQGSQMKFETFDRDPGWDAHHNRSAAPEPRAIRQDFGYDARGAAGGFVTPAAEPAYYAKVLPKATLEEPLTASGTLRVDDGPGNTLIGFFNSATLNEWRTPNTIALRVNARGEGFHLHVEYCTSRWRAGGDFFATTGPGGKKDCRLIPGGKAVHRWSLTYDPRGNGGAGELVAALGDEKVVLPLDPGHKGDGATFDRFGLLTVMKSADSGGSLWIDDLSVNGAAERFDADPGWEGRGNRRSYVTKNVRPRFDFGFSPTRHAGGQAGELGGLVFRGDERYPDRMAYYGDRLKPLTLDRPLRASGRVCLRRGVTDSTVLLGFFHSTGSMKVSTSQASGIPENFLGLAIEGPSSEGFLVYPLYGVDREAQGSHAGRESRRPYIYPDGRPHEWTLEYSPVGNGKLTVALDGQPVTLELTRAHREIGARFDRFGIVTTHIDGNAQEVYFDDLKYTAEP